MCRVTCYVTCYVGTLQRLIFHALSRPDRRGARHARAEPVTRSWGLAEARRGRSRQWRITGEQDVRVSDPEPGPGQPGHRVLIRGCGGGGPPPDGAPDAETELPARMRAAAGGPLRSEFSHLHASMDSLCDDSARY